MQSKNKKQAKPSKNKRKRGYRPKSTPRPTHQSSTQNTEKARSRRRIFLLYPILATTVVYSTTMKHRSHENGTTTTTRKQRVGKSSRSKRSFLRKCYKRWFRDTFTTFSSLFVAVVLWYTLGVVSIATSKILLSEYSAFPLTLTIQQLLIGSSLLRFLLSIRFLNLTKGLQPWPSHHNKHHTTTITEAPPYLVLSGIYFTLGFLATNFGFSGTNPAFVESIKAAEPITSALVAVGWGIETLSKPETVSLGTLVLGVLISTIGNKNNDAQITTPMASFKSCLIVMVSNLCFSFRGLYQKLLKKDGIAMDDINLQFRMQQVGVVALAIPFLLLETFSLLRSIASFLMGNHFLASLKYIGLSLVNGFAFTSYNLASTYILSRISVIHHATLNCIRRIFAVVVTSIAFAVPITLTSTLGILISVGSFMSFTHFKVQKQKQPKPISSLLPVSAVN